MDRPRGEREHRRREERRRPASFSRQAPRTTSGKRTNATSTAFPGAQRRAAATPSPTSGERPPTRAELPLARRATPSPRTRPRTRLARELVEHDPVRRVDEQRHGRRDRDTRPESPRGRRPGDHRAREEQRQAGSASAPPAKSSRAPFDDRRQPACGRASTTAHRIGVEELAYARGTRRGLGRPGAARRRHAPRRRRVRARRERRRRAGGRRAARAMRGPRRPVPSPLPRGDSLDPVAAATREQYA